MMKTDQHFWNWIPITKISLLMLSLDTRHLFDPQNNLHTETIQFNSGLNMLHLNCTFIPRTLMKIASLICMIPLCSRKGTSTIISILKIKTLNSKILGLWKTLSCHQLQRGPNLVFRRIIWATQQKYRFTGSAQQPQKTAQEHISNKFPRECFSYNLTSTICELAFENLRVV